MDKSLKEVLDGEYGNYILPLFWQRGDGEETIVEEIEKIYQSNIRSLCVESRVHEGFCGDTWWRDMDIIMREAKKRGMTVWLMDDKNFPTGYANGLIAKKYPHLRKRHIIERHIDAVGPSSGAFIVGDPGERTLLAAVAYRRSGNGDEICGEAVNLDANIKGNLLYWEVPEGCYRIFLIYETLEGGNPYYIHMIDEKSVDVLIEAVYEPHYQRYRDEFGKTFAGFFSDEPSFGNRQLGGLGVSIGFFDHSIGTQYLALPWRDDLAKLLSAELGGEDAVPLLPALWFELKNKTAKVRLAYMNLITRLYRDCFSRRLGDWCRDRNAQYIGHVIEDMNNSSHMGPGAGHYFRSLDGQDMAGIDVVLQQIVPGMANYGNMSPCYGKSLDPEFYHYTMAKLAASLSNIQPRMKGRAMCEIFGAYGWAEGTPMMKWLIDHMLVRGINWFMPHAFVPNFPDGDCPPHFYCRGNNPQFRDFGLLMDYANKVSHLFNGGHHIASAALLYHAEAEWCGGGYMYVQKPAKALYDRQLDFDIVSCDSLLESAYVDDGQLVIDKMKFPCLIIPYSEYLPCAVLEKINDFASHGLYVMYIGDYPKCAGGGVYTPDGNTKVVPSAKEAALAVVENGFTDITLDKPFEMLRVYHYVRGEAHYVMFFNEDMKTFSGTVKMPFWGDGAKLNLLTGENEKAVFGDEGVYVELAPYESCIFAYGCEGIGNIQKRAEKKCAGCVELKEFGISTAKAPAYPVFTPYKTAELHDITATEAFAGFGGYIRYEAEFAVGAADSYVLDMGKVGETAHVWVNGEYCGGRICNPYVVDITKSTKPGKNALVIEVANSLAYETPDDFSANLMLPASGLLGPVCVRFFKRRGSA